MLVRAVLGLSIALALPATATPPPAAGQSRSIQIPVRSLEDLPSPLAADAFSVELEGKKVPVGSVLTPADGQMILVVLDLTGDVAQVDPAKQAIIETLQSLPSTTFVALLRAQDGLRVVADPTSDRTVVANAVRDLTVSGRPGLIEVIDSVQALADSIARKSKVRVSVVYVTDSDVTSYREDFTNPVVNSSDPHDLSRRFPEQLIQEKISKLDSALAARQCSMHIVHLVNRSDRLNEAYQNGLKRLAEDAAGTSVFCRTSMEIPDAIRRAFQGAASEYSVIVGSPEHGPDRAAVQVSAKNSTGAEVRLVYRTRISLKEKAR